MDANRYFDKMHSAMSARHPGMTLLLRVNVQDLGGADACLELRQSADGSARVFYSTIGRRELNFQLVRRGWKLCHSADGQMTGSFPESANSLLDETDFSAWIRDEAVSPERTERIVKELGRCSGLCINAPDAGANRAGCLITADSFVGRGAHWTYWSTDAGQCPTIAAILCWLGDHLAGTERRVLQSSPSAVHLAAQWQQGIAQPIALPLDVIPLRRPAQAPAVAECAPRRPQTRNDRWQSMLAVLAAV